MVVCRVQKSSLVLSRQILYYFYGDSCTNYLKRLACTLPVRFPCHYYGIYMSKRHEQVMITSPKLELVFVKQNCLSRVEQLYMLTSFVLGHLDRYDIRLPPWVISRWNFLYVNRRTSNSLLKKSVGRRVAI